MSEARKGNPLRAALVAGGWILILLGTFWLALWALTARWERVTGKIEKAQFGVSWSSSRWYALDVAAVLKYSYAVQGRRYEGDRTTLVDWKIAWLYLHDEGVGDAVRVYYDPREPARSVLDRFDLLPGMAIFAIGCLLVAAVRWDRRSR